MKICPNCNKKINRNKITKLTDDSQVLNCQNCGAILKLDEFYLFNKKAVIDWIGIILVLIGLKTYDTNEVVSITLTTSGIILFLIGLRNYLKTVKLKVIAISDQEPMNVFTNEKGTSKGDNDVESYKRQFKLWSQPRLEEVLVIKKWSKPAKIAAKQLLDEKRNITS